jgi:thymidylate kinase
MAKNNYLVEGVSGTGKSSVCAELRNRGYRAIDGDKELAYLGNPETGERLNKLGHDTHIWDVEKLKQLIENKEDEVTFFCGGSRNFDKFIGLFDNVFILEVDADTLNQRLESRPKNAWGNSPEQRELILRLHSTKEDIPSDGVVIDATQPLEVVVNQIVQHIED